MAEGMRYSNEREGRQEEQYDDKKKVAWNDQRDDWKEGCSEEGSDGKGRSDNSKEMMGKR
jgi:hypothetical protein